jgi:hypothetical protein
VARSDERAGRPRSDKSYCDIQNVSGL